MQYKNDLDYRDFFFKYLFFVYCKNKLVLRYNDMCFVNEKN